MVKDMEEALEATKALLATMTPEEVDAMLIELGNDKAAPGSMFMSREDFKMKSKNNNSEVIGKYGEII
ncbi:hypothetical protein MmiEs2_10920 [Methanimicrococcus stummii]|uniref:Uncharacterized protein n=1 Tax=Methanimicrococcus stummii TaxID=3028294 RepID=A0AA96ZXE8_9EURY|nr:hypothetical protein [Methanimicrococcus sp. Es2]WNY28879.1 hypothetical protein MmiEs2_10920 [Methanimicrococcus sp. Es2]